MRQPGRSQEATAQGGAARATAGRAGKRPKGRRTLPTVDADHVRDIILAGLATGAGGEPWRVEGPVRRAKISVIFKAAHPEVPYPLAVKVFDRGSSPRVEEQAARLAHYREAMAGSPGLTVPAPFAALPEHRTLVMEWLDEPQVSRLFEAVGHKRQRRAELFTAAGRWLRAFHDASGMEDRPLDAGSMRQRIESNLTGRNGEQRATRNAAFHRALGVLVARMPAFEGVAVPHAAWHGDFNPNNILHGNGRTVGIDLAQPAVMPVTADICRFLIQAETAGPLPVLPSWLGPLGLARLDFEAFLSAYDPDGTILDRRVFDYLFLGEALARWAALFGTVKWKRTRILKHIRLRRMCIRAAAEVMRGG